MKLSPVTSRSSGVPVSPTEPLDHAAKSEFERAMGTQQPTRHDALQAHQHLLHTALGQRNQLSLLANAKACKRRIPTTRTRPLALSKRLRCSNQCPTPVSPPKAMRKRLAR